MKAAAWLILAFSAAAAVCSAGWGRNWDPPPERLTANRQPSPRQLDAEWRRFKLRFDKSYASQSEEKFRRQVWESNYRKVRHHSLLAKLGLRNFTLGINRFADLTSPEFAAAVLMKRTLPTQKRSAAQHPFFVAMAARPPSADPPARIDWRLKQCVSPVASQGETGSSAVYGVVGAIEGQVCARFGHQRTWLSRQQIIDCAESTESPDAIYSYLASNQGRLDTGIPDTCYPQTGKKGPCAFKANCTAAIVQAVAELPEGDEAALQSALAFAGPATVLVDASQPSFQLYRSGVYNEPNCSSQILDHVMLVVGYGLATTGEPYWLVQNSWGVDWGESGYILMSRNRGNQCGIASSASFPFVWPPY